MSTSQKGNSSRFNFLIDESRLSQGLGIDIPPLRVFTLGALGINAMSFIEQMAPTFSVLHLDPYDPRRARVEFLKRLFPSQTDRLDLFLAAYYRNYEDLDAVFDLISEMSINERFEFDRIGMNGRRKRSIARFQLYRTENGWHIERISARSFKQKVGHNDPRSLVRTFPEMIEEVTESDMMRRFLTSLAVMVEGLHPDVSVLSMTMHQVFIFADRAAQGDNSPEGIHQDGADYIVSALVVEREGILGGESIVYGPDKCTEYLRHTLIPGQGIFQADAGSPLWHYVTPVIEDPSVQPDFGHRSIFGVDINIIR